MYHATDGEEETQKDEKDPHPPGAFFLDVVGESQQSCKVCEELLTRAERIEEAQPPRLTSLCISFSLASIDHT